MAIVELKHVGKRYPGAREPAVVDFNLVTQDGEFVVLVGPSGCGKTTTMRMIAGLEEHTEGDILIGGVNVNGIEPRHRDIAMVFQNYALYPHMTVGENLGFSLKLKKLDKATIKERVESTARVLESEMLLDRKPRELSGGQRQRVALGRAIVRQPQVFLMDEPLSNLDAKLRVGMRAEIIKLHRSLGVTTFYVTHDQTEAMTMGQRVVVLRDGLVQQIGTPNDLYQRPANRFVAGFIGTPAMNFLRGKLEADCIVGQGFSLQLDAAGVHAATGRAEICVGFRPEHLHLARGEEAVGRLTGTVEVVEPLGPVTLIQVRVAATTLTAQIAPGRQVSMGDTVTLSCKPRMLYLFDAEADVLLKGIDLQDDMPFH